MIGKLSGLIDSIDDKSLILDVNGVGYIVFASRQTLSRIGGVGEAAKLFIEMIVREDSMTMYGFYPSTNKTGLNYCALSKGSAPKQGWRF